MDERTYGDILVKYPNLIEDDLTLIGREVGVCGRYIDLLFRDRHGRQLIVELKIVPINDKHVGQCLDYYAGLEDNVARLMLISPKVPLLKRKALDSVGIEWKEITFNHINQHLIAQNDNNFDDISRNNNIVIMNEAPLIHIDQVIETPFNNRIEYNNYNSIIYFNDRYHTTDPMNLRIVTSIENGHIYQKIEERLSEINSNRKYIQYTYNRSRERSWGFGSEYRRPNENEQNEFWSRLLWVHFTGRGEIKQMQLDIPDKFIGYFANTNIPMNENNYQTWATRYLIIKDYINKNTIDEIMDILVKIKL